MNIGSITRNSWTLPIIFGQGNCRDLLLGFCKGKYCLSEMLFLLNKGNNSGKTFGYSNPFITPP